ncbi:putative cytochrome P450 [Helianthus debilis subsp. tardiflorus]
MMLAAGTGTSISTMEWAMSLLLNNPSVLKKAHGEIEKYVGHDRCVLCCLMSHQRVAWSEDTMFLKGTMLLVNVWAIHNDPNIWGDPKKFRPERFEGLEGYRDGFKLMPFGFGRRGCPGVDMAMRLVRLALGSLIQCFEWERTGESEVDMSEGTDGVNTSKAISLVAICHPHPTMLNLLSQL